MSDDRLRSDRQLDFVWTGSVLTIGVIVAIPAAVCLDLFVTTPSLYRTWLVYWVIYTFVINVTLLFFQFLANKAVFSCFDCCNIFTGTLNTAGDITEEQPIPRVINVQQSVSIAIEHEKKEEKTIVDAADMVPDVAAIVVDYVPPNSFVVTQKRRDVIKPSRAEKVFWILCVIACLGQVIFYGIGTHLFWNSELSSSTKTFALALWILQTVLLIGACCCSCFFGVVSIWCCKREGLWGMCCSHSFRSFFSCGYSNACTGFFF